MNLLLLQNCIPFWLTKVAVACMVEWSSSGQKVLGLIPDSADKVCSYGYKVWKWQVYHPFDWETEVAVGWFF